MSFTTAQVSQGGRIVIPADIRKKMGIDIGDQVLLTWSEEDHELRVVTRKQKRQHAQELVRQYANFENSVVDELIRERRQAATNE